MKHANIPAIGSTIKLTYNLEIEGEDGYIDVVDAGKELTILAYDLEPGEDIESYVARWNSIPLTVEVGDVERYSQTDRSGQSDYTVNGGTLSIEVDVEDIA